MPEEHNKLEPITCRMVEEACEEFSIKYELRITCPDLLGPDTSLCMRVLRVQTLDHRVFLEKAKSSGWEQMASLKRWICPNCRMFYVAKLRADVLNFPS